MALLNQSSKATSAAVQEIADSAGASADPEMLNRAFRSYQASVEHMNTVANWDYMIQEAPPQYIWAPFTVNLTATSGITSATAIAGHGVLIDDLIAGPGISVDCRVTATAATLVGISVATLASYGNTPTGLDQQILRDMYPVPADYRRMYSIRMYTNGSTLRPIGRRFYERSITNTEFVAGTPVGYDVSPIASRSKVKLLPAPGYADAMGMRYYRRMFVASTSGDSNFLDIPQDYEPYMIAWAKWHFLTDKGEGRSQQAATWLAFAQEGVKKMLSDQIRQPDEDLMFSPGHYNYNPAWGPNSVRNTLDQWGP
jgi:hypothetical protein